MPPLAEDRYNRIVQTPSGMYVVRCRPRGAELRDAIDQPEILNWLSVWPGVLGLLGLLLHWTVYRRRWVVTAALPTVSRRSRNTAVIFIGGRADAECRFEEFVNDLKRDNRD